MSLAIRVEQRLESISREAWDRMVACCPDSTVFQSFGWIDSWARAFTDPLSLRIFAAFDGPDLVGVAPLWRNQHSDLTLSRQSLCFLGAGHSDYLTFPAMNASPKIINLLLDAIDGLTPPDTAIDLGEIPEASTLASCLTERGSHRSNTVVTRSTTACPQLLIRDNDMNVESALHKESARRQQEKLRKLGQLTVEHLSTADAVEPLLDGFFKQHVRRWSSTAFPSLFLRPQNQEFYRLMVRELGASGHLVFSVLRLNGHPIAQHLGMRSQQDLLWYKPTFDLDFGRYSPGQVLLKFLIEYARDEGYRALDFTRGEEAFKFRFSSGVTFNRTFLWARAPAHRLFVRLEHSARSTVRRIRSAFGVNRHSLH